MKVRLVTLFAPLAESLSEALKARGHEVELRLSSATESALRYAPSVSLDQVTGLVEQIKPLLPSVTLDNSLSGVDAEIHLGTNKSLGNWDLKVRTDSEELGERLRRTFQTLGYRDSGIEFEQPDQSIIKYGGADAFARQIVRWFLAQEGVHTSEDKDWDDDDNDIWVYVKDPSFVGKSPKQRYPIDVMGDDYEQALALKDCLVQAGFEKVEVRSLDSEKRPRFWLHPGPLLRHDDEPLELRTLVQQFLNEHGVDEDKFPLSYQDDGDRGRAVIHLPLGLHARGELRPWEGNWPERWELMLRTDDLSGTEPLMRQFSERGFVGAKMQSLSDKAFAFAIRCSPDAKHCGVLDEIKEAVDTALAARGLEDDNKVAISVVAAEDPDANDRIVLELPFRAAGRMPYAERLREAARGWEFALKTPRAGEYPELEATLRELPWSEFAAQADSGSPEIQYGGAPLALVEYVRDLVEQHTGVRLEINKSWGDGDDDIWVWLSGGGEVDQRPVDDRALDLSAWLNAGRESVETRPLVEIGADKVRIGDITLPRRRSEDEHLVPRPELFDHYCLDARTAESLIHVAESALLREPCLLEGETSVSKTSIVQYLAMLTNQPLVRINLNGQTDTGELVGRYVPQDIVTALPMDPSELLEAQELLEQESRMILRRAADAGRSLTQVEVQQIMANERMTVHPWRWQDGLVVTAMKRGWWVVLDELNLAEPQILERLNPVLERHPSIVLTEHDNSVIGGSALPVHPDFRMFATMNPAEYAGRSPLSPAYRDRWRAYRYVQPAGEAEYLAMLRYLIYGSQPEVEVQGQRWLGADDAAPPLGGLADVDGIDDFLRALARFHAALEEAVGRRGSRRSGAGLGSRRRESYVFSRRGLLAVMDFLSASLSTEEEGLRSMRRSLCRYYLNRVQPGADQRIVAQLLDAAGIGPGTWAPDQLDQLASSSGDSEDSFDSEHSFDSDDDEFDSELDSDDDDDAEFPSKDEEDAW